MRFRRKQRPPKIKFITYDVIPTEPGARFILQFPEGVTAEQVATFTRIFKDEYPNADGLIIAGAKVTVL